MRDGLADLRDWWAEGVPLRCIPVKTTRGLKELSEPSIVRLAKLCSPLNPDLWQTKETPNVPRITTVDSRLGDAFCLLAAVVHAEIVFHKDASALGEAPNRRSRRYQSVYVSRGEWLVRFRPTGEDIRYFKNFVARINAAGWRPQGRFPVDAVFAGADFRQTLMTRLSLSASDFRKADLSRASLGEVKFGRADLAFAILKKANLAASNLRRANLHGADLRIANLRAAELTGANLREANLTEANLRLANLRGADLCGADLTAADLRNANFRGAALAGAV